MINTPFQSHTRLDLTITAETIRPCIPCGGATVDETTWEPIGEDLLLRSDHLPIDSAAPRAFFRHQIVIN